MFKIQSLKLLDKLKQLRESVEFDNFTVSLKVPDELFWWIFLEFGTGKYNDDGKGHSPEGYDIYPKSAKDLVFFDMAQGNIRFEKHVFTLGIPAFHPISTIWDDIHAYQKSFIAEKLKQSNYDTNAVRELIYAEMMPKIKEMVIDSFRENLPNHVRDTGRIDGKTATQAFEEGLEIE